MALIKCPECGKEVSDKASACPNCGCPIEKKINVKPHIGESFEETGRTGRKGLECPNIRCRGVNIQVINDIPTWKKVADIAAFGTTTEITKIKYRKDMIYKCKDCGTVWNDAGILDEIPEVKTNPKSKYISIILFIVSLIYFGIILYSVTSSIGGINTNILQFLYSLSGILGAIFIIISLKRKKMARISTIMYLLSEVISIFMILKLDLDIIFSLIPLIFIALSDICYEK